MVLSAWRPAIDCNAPAGPGGPACVAQVTLTWVDPVTWVDLLARMVIDLLLFGDSAIDGDDQIRRVHK